MRSLPIDTGWLSAHMPSRACRVFGALNIPSVGHNQVGVDCRSGDASARGESRSASPCTVSARSVARNANLYSLAAPPTGKARGARQRNTLAGFQGRRR